MSHKHTSLENAARALGGHSRTTRSAIAPLTGATSASAVISPVSDAGSVLNGATGGSLGGNADMVQGIQQLASTLGQTTTAQQATLNGLLENTQALTQNTSAVNTKNSPLTAAGNVASSVLGGGSGISPLLTGLLSLFGIGSQPQTVVPQIRYVAPPSVNLSGAVGGNSTSGSSASQSVNIQVNAMDSKSFLDHSEDIAQAVRQAILNSSNLNDVIAAL